LERKAIPVLVAASAYRGAIWEGLVMAYIYIALAALPAMIMAGVLIWRYGFLEPQIRG
jgi:hypothetical protein